MIMKIFAEDQIKHDNFMVKVRLQKQQPSLNTTLDFPMNRLVNFTRRRLFRKVVLGTKHVTN